MNLCGELLKLACRIHATFSIVILTLSSVKKITLGQKYFFSKKDENVLLKLLLGVKHTSFLFTTCSYK